MIEPLPCPKCGSHNIGDEYGGLTTSQLGYDYQGGTLKCMDCKLKGPWISARGTQTDILKLLITTAWNTWITEGGEYVGKHD